MLTLKVECSMCDRKPPLELYIQGAKDLNPQKLRKQIEAKDWTVQFNGDNMDTYCTKKCAE